MSITHGSHPNHFFRRCDEVPQGAQCSVCCANYFPTSSPTTWFFCDEAGCEFTLCMKCFEVEEQLFDFTQIVIRNPLLPMDTPGASVRTRPRDGSYELCPLYPGKLMAVVSSARSLSGTSDTYFRLRSGGWISAAQVVCVIPSESLIERLAAFHMSGGEGRSSEALSPRETMDCIEESVRLLNDNPTYGTVMTSLTFFPVLTYLEHGPQQVNQPTGLSELPQASVRFVFFVLHYMLDTLQKSLQADEPIQRSIILPLHIDIIGSALLVIVDLVGKWGVDLPAELGPLVISAAALLMAVGPLLQGEYLPVELLNLRRPSVITGHVELSVERSRVGALCFHMTEIAAQLLRSVPHFYRIQQLQPIRTQLALTSNETLERILCELVTAAVDRQPSLQMQVIGLDMLEVAVRLAKKATSSKSQIAVFQLITRTVHRSRRAIAQTAAIIVPPLMHLATHTSCHTAALDCLSALAFNDPIVDLGGSRSSLGPEPPQFPMCSSLVHPRCAPYQRMTTYAVGGLLVAHCDYCAIHCTPPPNGVVCEENRFAYFACQCLGCTAEKATHPLPPPAYPMTAAINTMNSLGLSRFLLGCVKQGSDVLNAAGRLILKVVVGEEVLITLLHQLLERGIAGNAEAALAVAAHSHLCSLSETCQRHPTAAISQYVLQLPSFLGAEACSQPNAEERFWAGKNDGTPSTDPRSWDNGLTPSPDVQLSMNEGKSSAWPSADHSSLHPAVGLFQANSPHT